MSDQPIAAKSRGGRPRKNPEEKMQQFSIRLPQGEIDALQLMAGTLNESASGAVSALIRRAMKDPVWAELATIKKEQERVLACFVAPAARGSGGIGSTGRS